MKKVAIGMAVMALCAGMAMAQIDWDSYNKQTKERNEKILEQRQQKAEEQKRARQEAQKARQEQKKENKRKQRQRGKQKKRQRVKKTQKFLATLIGIIRISGIIDFSLPNLFRQSLFSINKEAVCFIRNYDKLPH